MKRFAPCILAHMLLALLLSGQALAAPEPPPSVAELWAIVQQQQARIEQLEDQYQSATAQLAATDQKISAQEQRVAENTERVIATGNYAESLAIAPPAGTSWTERTQVGGYGELHYNNLSATDSDNDVKEVDFHRFVTYFNHQFNDRLRLFTELELEHSIAGEGKKGEIELEQAYIQYDLNDQHVLNGGLFLIPVGILNQVHEPNTFYGVERNSVEKIVIPTTWWEGGAEVGGRYASGLSWDIAATSGLAIPTTGTKAFQIRAGRQKVSEASANDLAYTGRLKYTGVPGLEVAAVYQLQTDASQVAGDGLDEGQLFSTHAIFQKGWFGLRALYAGWKFNGYAVDAAGAERQNGWYVEPALTFSPGNYDIGFYARFEDLDAYQDQFQEWQVGMNYWPVPKVVLKFDYRDRSYRQLADQGSDFDGFDLGLGYSF